MKFWSQEVIFPLYPSFQLESCVQFWVPPFQKDSKILEQFLRRATKQIFLFMWQENVIPKGLWMTNCRKQEEHEMKNKTKQNRESRLLRTEGTKSWRKAEEHYRLVSYLKGEVLQPLLGAGSTTASLTDVLVEGLSLHVVACSIG